MNASRNTKIKIDPAQIVEQIAQRIISGWSTKQQAQEQSNSIAADVHSDFDRMSLKDFCKKYVRWIPQHIAREILGDEEFDGFDEESETFELVTREDIEALRTFLGVDAPESKPQTPLERIAQLEQQVVELQNKMNLIMQRNFFLLNHVRSVNDQLKAMAAGPFAMDDDDDDDCVANFSQVTLH